MQCRVVFLFAWVAAGTLSGCRFGSEGNGSGGTGYFALSAVSLAGTESNPTAVVSMTIG